MTYQLTFDTVVPPSVPFSVKNRMGGIKKLIYKAYNSPQNLRFNELCKMAEYFGFEYRGSSGGHKIYKHPSLREIMNFQPDKHDTSKAKSYQVKQLIKVIEQYNLWGDNNV